MICYDVQVKPGPIMSTVSILWDDTLVPVQEEVVDSALLPSLRGVSSRKNSSVKAEK